MIRNPLYSGLIYLSAYRDEKEQFIEGIHEPIITRMLDRSNKAVRERDKSNYALKVALTKNVKLKRRINAIESLMGKERTVNKVDINPEQTIAFGLLTILSIVVFQVKF